MKINPTIGKMACLCCGQPIAVKRNEVNTLSVSCRECDFSAYAKQGTDAHGLVMKRVTLRQAPDAPSAPARPAPTHTPKPAPAGIPSAAIIKKNTVFG